VKVTHGPSAGWVTCRADDDAWTHVIDDRGRVWTRAEHEVPGFTGRGRKRHVRPKLHGEQLALPTEDP
jgi:hypothetical protein